MARLGDIARLDAPQFDRESEPAADRAAADAATATDLGFQTLGAGSLGLLAFSPEAFFIGRTEGHGVVRDAFGRIVRRCRIVTSGAFSAAQQALRFDETFTYDDGETDIWRWVMQPGRDGRYMAAEAKAGSGLVGERQGDDYVISFRRPAGRAKGPLSPHYRSRFTLLAPDIALKRADVSLLGVPMGSLSAIHRRVAAQ
jgi:hypothetical protein